MGPARALWRLGRPGNALMAAAGVLAGGVAYSPRPEWGPLAAAALAGAFGVAGGNALNDALDASLDRQAHPERPIPRGLVGVQEAFAFSIVCFGLALWLSLVTNLFVVLFASFLVLCLVAYEIEFKARGLTGNLLVSGVVAGTFLLGALAAPLPFRTYDAAALATAWDAAGLAVPLAMAGLALLANAAREVYKDVVDAAHDRGERTTLPHRLGAGRSMLVASGLLGLAVAVALLPYGLRLFPFPTLSLVAPALAVFVVAMVQREPDGAARTTKAGMILALLGFLLVGLLRQ